MQAQLDRLEHELKAQHDEMQAQIDALKAQLAARENEATSARAATVAAQQQTIEAQQSTAVAAQQTAETVKALEQTQANTAAQVAEVHAQQTALKVQVEQPTAFHYKGLTLTPSGYIAAESVWRASALHADIYTPYNLTPYSGNADSKVTEWVPSARQTRFGVMAEGMAGKTPLKAFVETDFLSAGTTSNALQTNSYTLRLRQAWVQATLGKTTLNAGQMWTLATENKKAALAGQEALPATIDNNFNVGTTWLRQLGFRVQQQVTPSFTLALALESAQYQFAASNTPNNFFFGGNGVFQGLNNQTFQYTNQLAPDIIVKASFDPGWGHYELGGIGRFFRDRYYPDASATNAKNDTKFGGGLIANARMPITKKLDLALHLVAGDGTGRYGASLLPDITVHPDGRLEPLRNAQGLASLELHPTRSLDFYGYGGVEYVQRTYYRSSTGTLVGYGVPTADNSGCNTEVTPSASGTPGFNPGSGTCTGHTRRLAEGQFGFWYRPVQGPAGKLQLGAAYGYLNRAGWTGVGGAPQTSNHLVWTSIRYILP
ncbi:hypothetical protein ACFQBQ_02975 [Granulicella cerasi]|uniref:Uncharacterized protein n=1 Tax=Granulicella cerasi TaxID=741063 RepID=A0ABW1Z652_9BACT|nr:hypothetical protein [Granulicella cerasi]